MPVRFGLLGGTFDPIHLGHVAAGRAAKAALGLDRLTLVPAHVPPHRAVGPRASPHHRFAMAAIVALDEPGWTVSDAELRRDGPSYTYDTLLEVQAGGVAPTQIFFITGADAFAEIATWSRFPAVLDQAHFVVVTRPGARLAEFEARVPGLAGRVRTPDALEASAGTAIVLLEADTPDISSTAIRGRAAGGYSLAGLVPPRVEQYIRRHGLYAASATGAGALHGQDE